MWWTLRPYFSPFNLPEFQHFPRLVKIFSVTTWLRKNIFPFWCIGYFSVKNHLFIEKKWVEFLDQTVNMGQWSNRKIFRYLCKRKNIQQIIFKCQDWLWPIYFSWTLVRKRELHKCIDCIKSRLLNFISFTKQNWLERKRNSKQRWRIKINSFRRQGNLLNDL